MLETDRTIQGPDGVLARVAMGDARAVRECIERFGGLIWSLARKSGFTSAEAEDAVQEIMIDVWRSAPKYDPGIASEATFVSMIARRRLIDRRRRAARRPEAIELGEGVAQDASASGWRGPHDAASSVGEMEEEVGRAVEALDQLAPDQQRVLRLSIYRGLSHELISRTLNMPLGTVKTHARRGLIRIRELLSGIGSSRGQRAASVKGGGA